MFGWFKKKAPEPPELQQADALEDEVREGPGGEDALAAYAALTELAAAHPEFPDIRRLLANAAVNLVRRCIHETLEEDRAVVAQIETLAADHPDEAILRACLMHLIWEYAARVPSDDTDQLRELYHRQRSLYRTHEDVRAHASPMVKTATKLMGGHLIKANIATARELHVEIAALAQRHPDDSEVQRDRAGSSLNLISRLVTVDDMGAEEYELGKTYLEELEDFAARFPQNSSVQDMLAQAREYFG